jgi:hypothetical protein
LIPKSIPKKIVKNDHTIFISSQEQNNINPEVQLKLLAKFVNNITKSIKDKVINK